MYGNAREEAMTPIAESNQKASRTGLVLHKATGYDLLLWLVTRGREQAFREEMLSLVSLQPGESVLDVGCGTGTLAILAKRQVELTGEVYGIDASPEMIARAEKKATKAKVDVAFKNAYAQSLPFRNACFDVVLTTLMLHHLPKNARAELAGEIRRVLKPGGRVLATDFGVPAKDRKSLVDHFHRRHDHGHVDFREIIALLKEAGLAIAKSGAVGMRDLQFVVATAPYCA
jgi:ubiquinone/menaquinone biosynthesis C-methylase UbiE